VLLYRLTLFWGLYLYWSFIRTLS